MEREKASATLATALAWIVLAHVVMALLDLGRVHLVDMWVIPAHEMNWDEPKPKFYTMLAEPAQMFRIWLMNPTFSIADLYARLWLIPGPITEFAHENYYRITLFALEQQWLFSIRGMFLRPVYFLLSMGIYHSTARLLGGRGQFGRYVYLFTLFGIPIAILPSLLDFLPLLGPVFEISYRAAFSDASSQLGEYLYYTLDFPYVYIISWLLSFYGIALAYMATKVEHGITGWRAVIVVAIGYVMAYVIRNSLFYLALSRNRAVLEQSDCLCDKKQLVLLVPWNDAGMELGRWVIQFI